MPQIEVTQRATGRDIGQRVRFAVAPRLVGELRRHIDDAALDLFALPVDRLAALLLGGPRRFAHDRHRGIAHAVSQCFPALDGDALPAGLGDQPRYRAHRVEVFDDHA
jgi:hypothetical protein